MFLKSHFGHSSVVITRGILRIARAGFALVCNRRYPERASPNIPKAKKEYELLGETIVPQDRDLVLRQPQLQTVQAKLKTAEAALPRAPPGRDGSPVSGA